MLPNKWRLQSFEECPASDQQVPFWDVYSAVALEAFLWGFGTAIGELPPYFVALSASLAGTKNEELDEIMENN